MRNKFVIAKPRPGRSTVSLVTHVYDQLTKRTRTVYLGSYSIYLDPESIPVTTFKPGQSSHGISLRPAVPGAEVPFELTADDLNCIRGWLRLHGSQAHRAAEAQAHRLALEQAQSEQRIRMRAQIELEVRARLEADWHAEVEARLRTESQDPLETAVKALNAAAVHVKEAARVHALRGARLTHLRSTRTSISPGGSKLDSLQAKCNFIRLVSAIQFEIACKEAGLMVQRSKSQ